MSARKPSEDPQAPQPQPQRMQSLEEARAADLVHQSQDLADNPRDVTVEGGRYEVNGQMVDANGDPIKGRKSGDGE